MPNNIPLEKYEAEELCNYLKANGYYFFNIMSESSIRLPIQVAAARKRQGLAKGFADYVIFLKNKKALLFLELKRQKRILKSGKEGKSPSIVSEEQKIFEARINEIPNCEGVICYGAASAIEIIKSIENR